MTCEFRVYGIPKGQPRPRAFVNRTTGRARVYDAGTAEAWKGAVALSYNAVRTEAITVPIKLRVKFYLPYPKRLEKTVAKQLVPHVSKPDLDNLVKSTMDALTGAGAWTDDALVCWVDAFKIYAGPDDAPGALIAIISEGPNA